MKKLALLFAGLSLFVATGCNDDDNNTIEYPLVGTWQPIKEVDTTIPTGGGGFSDEITYSDCQKQSRWVFMDGTGGKRTDMGDGTTPGQCTTGFDRTFTYMYDKAGKTVQIKYQGIVDPSNGIITTLNDTTLNLKFEDTSDPNEYHSATFTFKRVVQ
jgi:hypothetical protein